MKTDLVWPMSAKLYTSIGIQHSKLCILSAQQVTRQWTVRIREKDGHYKADWKPAGFDTNQVFLSPSIRYVATPLMPNRPSKARNKKNFTRFCFS
jgi:hypothetical protein